MDTTTIGIAILAAILVLIIGAFLGVAFYRRQRSKTLREKFGPEYERAVTELGDPRKAEEELEARVEHVKSLDIQPLSDEQKDRYTREWRATQAEFVDQPVAAIQDADRLITEVMAAKGYPVEDFDQRAADISVDYPGLVEHYRGMRAIAARSENEEVNTEELRQAMVHSRALFEELVGTDISEYDKQKEKL
jgi:hypothetical protein